MTKEKAIRDLNECFTEIDTMFTEIKVLSLPLAEYALGLGHICLMKEQARSLQAKLTKAIAVSNQYEDEPDAGA